MGAGCRRCTIRSRTEKRQRFGARCRPGPDAFVAAGWDGNDGASFSALASGYYTDRGVAPELHVSAPRRWRQPVHQRAMLQVRASAPTRRNRFGSTSVSTSVGLLDARLHIDSYSDLTYSTISGTEDGDERVISGRVAVTQVTPSGAEWRSAVTVNDVSYDEMLNTAPASIHRKTSGSSTWRPGNMSARAAGGAPAGRPTMRRTRSPSSTSTAP